MNKLSKSQSAAASFVKLFYILMLALSGNGSCVLAESDDENPNGGAACDIEAYDKCFLDECSQIFESCLNGCSQGNAACVRACVFSSDDCMSGCDPLCGECDSVLALCTINACTSDPECDDSQCMNDFYTCIGDPFYQDGE